MTTAIRSSPRLAWRALARYLDHRVFETLESQRGSFSRSLRVEDKADRTLVDADAIYRLQYAIVIGIARTGGTRQVR